MSVGVRVRVRACVCVHDMTEGGAGTGGSRAKMGERVACGKVWETTRKVMKTFLVGIEPMTW